FPGLSPRRDQYKGRAFLPINGGSWPGAQHPVAANPEVSLVMASREFTGGGFSMETLRLPLAALGIFGILAGLGALLVEGQFGLIERILIAAGVLLLGIYVALDPEDVWAKMTGRGALYSGNTLVIAVAALVILGFVNVLGARFTNKIDLTANKQFTLSDQ